MIIAFIILAIILLLNTRVRVYIQYKNDELYAYFRVFGFIKKQIYPEKPPQRYLSIKQLKKTRNKLHRTNKNAEHKQKKQKKTVGKAFTDVKDMVKELLELIIIILKRFIGKVRIKVKKLCITVATGDAASTALCYSAVCNTLDIIIDILSDRDKVDCSFIEPVVDCDYIAEHFTAEADILISIRIWQIIKGLFEALTEEIKGQDRDNY